jgi:uncharacterized integral membrane protein
METQTAVIIFKIANAIVMPQWFAMVVLPNNKYTKLLVDSFAIPLGLAVLYAVVIGIFFANPSGAGGNFSTLEGVKALFTSDIAVLAGWIHYLAFDLLVGRYIFKQAAKMKANRIVVSVCLFFTLMFGPVGFLIFSIYAFQLRERSITTH